MVENVYFGKILRKYTPRDEVARTNFRAARRNENSYELTV